MTETEQCRSVGPSSPSLGTHTYVKVEVRYLPEETETYETALKAFRRIATAFGIERTLVRGPKVGKDFRGLFLVPSDRVESFGIVLEWTDEFQVHGIDTPSENITSGPPQDYDKIRRAVPELVGLMQSYLDEAPTESDGFLVGLDITNVQAQDLFNDFVLYVNAGVEPETEVKHR